MILWYFFAKSYLFVVVGIFALASTLGFSYAQSFQTPLDLSKDIADSHEPQITIAGNNTYIIWTGFGRGVEDQDDVFFKKSSDGGATFSDTINLSDDIGSSFNPRMAFSGNNVYVIWQDDTGNTGNTSIFFQKSSDSGATFSDTINLSKDSGFAVNPQISKFGNSVFIIWQDDTPGPDEILYKRSIDNGSSFETLNISQSVDTDSIDGTIYAVNNKVYIVWTEGNFDEGRTSIFARASSDGGAAFSESNNLSNDTGYANVPKVSAFGDNEYVLWMQGKFNQGEMMFKKSSDGGGTFGQAIRLSDTNDTSSNPLLFTDGRFVYSVWMSNETNKANVYSRSSSNYGATFENVMNLSRGSFGVSNLALAGNKSSICVVWEENSTTGSNIAFRRSNDAGATFSDTINLSKNSGNSSYPAISIYNNKSYIVWQGNIDGTNHIMFTREN
jgi:hypothetical protein